MSAYIPWVITQRFRHWNTSRRCFCPSHYLPIGVLVHTRGESSRASHNLRQFFLHPRTAIEEPDKVVERICDSCPRHRAVRAPRGTKHDGGSLRLQNEYSKSARQLWSAVRGQRENQSFILCSANTWAAFLRECARVLLWANSMIFQKVGLKIISAPLSLSYVKSVSPWWKSDRIRRWPIPRVDEEKYCRRNFLHRLGTIDLIIVWLHSVC